MVGKKIEICHTGTGIPRPYLGPWRVGSVSRNFIPGGYVIRYVSVMEFYGHFEIQKKKPKIRKPNLLQRRFLLLVLPRPKQIRAPIFFFFQNSNEEAGILQERVSSK
ncbi:hypothetical protein M9H77_09619 [Catharanthus roseus]|uniref:Uncharacterized protein n=1 Tax=Catharanthus roseus TaxID=4058 RepID=A0ACC0C1B3_CATRO|nr:hypothetical protein M9H77_09619 [Catharanthus roseus]